MAPDAVAAAVAAVEEQPAPVPMRQFAARIASTGRQGVILLPPDATDGEIAEFCGWVLSAVLATYRQEREQAAPASRIVVPVGAVPPQLLRRD